MTKNNIWLGCDPGKRNFSVSVWENKRLLHTEIMKNTITNLTENDKKEEKFSKQLHIYNNAVKYICKTYNPKVIALERFQTRGHGGNLIEIISTMNGVWSVIALNRKVPCYLVTASAWKNTFNKTLVTSTLKDLYEVGKKEKIQAHTIDSSLISFYGAYLNGLIPHPYKWLLSRENRKRFFQQLR